MGTVERYELVYGKDLTMKPAEGGDWCRYGETMDARMAEVEQIEDCLYMDGYDDCLLGHVERCGSELIALYSMRRLVDAHIRDGMDVDEALEFIGFNQAGAYVGEKTPMFFDDF